MRERVTGVIIENGKVLLIQRIKSDTEYFIFPGGGVDAGETFEEALKREVMEELTLEVKKYQFLFTLENISIPPIATMHTGTRNDPFFLITEYAGNPEIGGPERERMNEQNQYHIVWLDLEKLKTMDNVYPKEGVMRLLEVLTETKRE